jgi:dihydrodipicolinate synthase/N-acetylneuraminate lyase
VPSLAGVKISRPDAQAIRRLIDATPEHMMVLAGNEAIALGSLALGANGMISGLATAVPEPFVTLTKQVADGDIAAAQQTQKLINRLLAFTPANRRIGMIKSILNDRGINVGTAVPPRAMPETAVWPLMERELAR